MACSKCKKKELREQMEKEAVRMEKWAIITIVLVAISAVYGLYSLIVNLL